MYRGKGIVLKVIGNEALLPTYCQLKMAKSHENGRNWVFQLVLSLLVMILRDQASKQSCSSLYIEYIIE